MGRKGAWGGREYGADGSMGRKGVWGEKEYGAEGSLGRKGVWGGREYGALGTSRHTILHLHPQATTFLSPPGGIYLIFARGANLAKCSEFKLKKRPCARQQTESVNATHRVSPAGRRPPAAGKLAVGAARRIGGDERGGA